MIEPKETVIDGKTFILSKCPATAGRRIVALYPSTALPKVGNYDLNEETMLNLISFVAIKNGDQMIQLTTKGLVDNHVGSWETLAKLEMAMLEYNCSFLQNGRISTFFDDFAQKLPTWISEMLTTLLVQLSEKGKPPSTN